MAENENEIEPEADTFSSSAREGLPTPKKSSPAWILFPVIIAFILIPFFFWQGTWFGKRIENDAQLESMLIEARDAQPGEDGRVPGQILRHAQHALEELTKRLDPMVNRRTDPRETGDIEKFYPLVLELSTHHEPVLRRTVAWLMQFDRKATVFDEALRAMLTDSDCLVRRNAALGLCRRKDTTALPVIRKMLEPYQVLAELAGKVSAFLPVGDPVQQDMELARIRPEGAPRSTIVRAPYGSEILRLLVAPDSHVDVGTPLVELKANSEQIRNAIVALGLLGEEEDQARIKAFEASMDREIRALAVQSGKNLERRLN